MLHDVEPDDGRQGTPPGHQLSMLDLLTLGIWGLMFLAVGWMALVMRDPYGPFNPLPPPPPPTQVTVIPYGGSDQAMLPEWAAVPSRTPTATATVLPTLTPFETATPLVVIATVTPAPPTNPAPDSFPYMLEGDAVLYRPNANDNGCNWHSIAGQVTNAADEPVPGLYVHISGEGVDELVATGTAEAFGAGGYELMLGDTPRRGIYTVELIGQSNEILSDQVIVETIERCEQNVAVVNFVQNR